MKKTIVTFGIVIFFSGVLLLFCGQSNRHSKLPSIPASYSPFVSSHHEKDSSEEYEDFKQLVLFGLRNNESRLIRLHAEIDSGSKQLKAKYFTRILELRYENNRLRNRIVEYTECNQHDWMAFKRSLTEEMNQLRLTISNFQISRKVLI